MPNGPIHQAANVTLAATIGAFALREPLVLPVALGAISASAISPDLDISAFAPRGLWRTFWRPYERAFPHRSSSHIAVFGATTRLAYLLAIPAVVVWLVAPGLWTWLMGHWEIGLLYLVGLSLADALHLVMDVGQSRLKGRHWAGWHRKL